jgi:hypothetical protein
MMGSMFDPEKLRISTSIRVSSKRSDRCGKMFIKGPIPLGWITKAAGVEGKTLHVAIALWFLAGLKRSRTVALSQSALRLFGVSRQAGYRALFRLEGAGLVSVERHQGRNPIVTIRVTDTELRI